MSGLPVLAGEGRGEPSPAGLGLGLPEQGMPSFLLSQGRGFSVTQAGRTSPAPREHAAEPTDKMPRAGKKPIAQIHNLGLLPSTVL